MATAVTNNTTTGTTSSTTSGTKTSRTTLNANFDTFLKMLTTQLQNQDPLAPTDTAQFTNQLVMYSQVEQQLSTNDKLDEMIAGQKQTGTQALLGYMGYYVEAKTSNMALQNGGAFFNVTLADDAAKLNIGIYDEDGKLVKSFSTTGTEGKSTFTWDGTNTQGIKVEDGSYTIKATATRADGTNVTSTVSTYGLVTSIDIDSDGNSVLKADSVTIDPDSVLSVRGATQTTTPDDDKDTTTTTS